MFSRILGNVALGLERLQDTGWWIRYSWPDKFGRGYLHLRYHGSIEDGNCEAGRDDLEDR